MTNYITTNEADIKNYEIMSSAKEAIKTTGEFVFDGYRYTDMDSFRIYFRFYHLENN